MLVLKFSFVINYNLQVGEANIGNTEGLCGLYDRNADNDFTKSGGQTIAAHVEEFAKSWVFGSKCRVSQQINLNVCQ